MTARGGKVEEERNAETVERDLEDVGIIKPLDGGYGWFVVFASFLANMIVDGIIFTAGDALLSLWKQDFNTSDTASALTISILSGSYLLVGPIASALANLYGCRTVVIAGTFLAFFGFICSTIAPEIFFLYISFGLVGGIGFGLIYLPAIVIIAQYFAEKRALATGLAVCGSGIGTTIFSSLNPIVMDVVGNNWRLFLVYLAGATLICIISGSIYKPVEASSEQIEQVTRIATEFEQQYESEAVGILPNSEYVTQGITIERLNKMKPMFNAERPFLSTIELNAHKKHAPDMWSQRDIVQAVARDSVRDLNRPLSRMDIFYTGSTNNLRARSKTVSVAKLAEDKSVEDGRRQTRESNLYLSTIGLRGVGESELSEDSGWKHNLKVTLGSLLDTSLLYSPSFMILAVSGFLTLSCFYVPYNYLGQHLNKIEGLSSAQKALPISLLGIINILARVVCGWISDRPQVDALLVSNITLIFAGIATCLVPFFTKFWQFIFYCFPFATGVACFAALRSVICVDLFGLEKLSNAFGILLTFMGIGAVFGSPLAALLKDMTGNFDVSFYIMGILMALSGVICIPLRRLRQWEAKRVQTKDALHTAELQKLN